MADTQKASPGGSFPYRDTFQTKVLSRRKHGGTHNTDLSCTNTLQLRFLDQLKGSMLGRACLVVQHSRTLQGIRKCQQVVRPGRH